MIFITIITVVVVVIVFIISIINITRCILIEFILIVMVVMPVCLVVPVPVATYTRVGGVGTTTVFASAAYTHFGSVFNTGMFGQ